MNLGCTRLVTRLVHRCVWAQLDTSQSKFDKTSWWCEWVKNIYWKITKLWTLKNFLHHVFHEIKKMVSLRLKLWSIKNNLKLFVTLAECHHHSISQLVLVSNWELKWILPKGFREDLRNKTISLHRTEGMMNCLLCPCYAIPLVFIGYFFRSFPFHIHDINIL